MATPKYHRFIFPTLVVITFISPFANHMFIPAMPFVKEEFKIGDPLAFATLSTTMISMAFTTIIYGGISDEWGRKKVLLGGLILYTIGAIICWFAQSIEALLFGRVFQGAGAGCGPPVYENGVGRHRQTARGDGGPARSGSRTTTTGRAPARAD